jgi:hypothetical protein
MDKKEMHFMPRGLGMGLSRLSKTALDFQAALPFN